MPRKWSPCLLAGLLAMSIGPANAQRTTAVDVAKEFPDQQQAILDDLRGEKYSEISPQDRKTVVQALERITARLADGATPQQLSESERVALYNDQSLVNTILTRAGEDSRVVCRREKTIGSQRAQNQCMTVAERRRQRNSAQDTLLEGRRTGKVAN